MIKKWLVKRALKRAKKKTEPARQCLKVIDDKLVEALEICQDLKH